MTANVPAICGWKVQPNGYLPGVEGAVNEPVPPPPEIEPVSNLCVFLSVRVWAAESLFTTVTFVPALTVSAPL